MFEKTKENLKDYLKHQKNDPQHQKAPPAMWRDAAAGFAMLLIFLFLAYSVGRADGRQSEIDQIPQLAAVQAHLLEVEKACQLRFDTPKVESQVVGVVK